VRGAAAPRHEAARPDANGAATPGSIREVRLLGGGGGAPVRRVGGVVEWAGRAYRVAAQQVEPLYLHLELEPIPRADLTI
jgi:hypothetical protein